MKKYLRSLSMLIALFTLSAQLQAQSNTAFAITGESKGNVNWTVIREVDLATGALVRNIYTPATQKPVHINTLTGKAFEPEAAVSKVANTCGCAVQSLSAASAYDAKQNRLYFTTIFGNDLQYIDLNQRDLKIYHVKNSPLKAFTSEAGEADNVTRMAIGADGYGYALTNNGNHLIRFSTGKNIVVTDLGSLKDGSNSSNTSVHTQAASWGGDMIADKGGNLYLFTVSGSVFKINPSTLAADFVGAIKNLPAPFSVNAAAVDKNGSVIVSSSVDANNYYKVSLNTLEAVAIERKEDKVFNASDFANGNFADAADKKNTTPLVDVKFNNNNLVSIYPNPVQNKTVNVYFHTSLKGKHMIEVVDVAGKKIASATLELNAKSTSKTIQLPAGTVTGMYVVRVMNTDNKNIFSGSVMVD